jgi:phage-related protein
MQKWEAYYYTSFDNKCELRNFLEKLSINNRQKVLSWISLLEEKGPTLPRPYSDILEDGMHELCIKLAGRHERILYFFVFQNYIILTHSFTKKTSSVPKSEIQKAKKCREDFVQRFKNINDFKKYIVQ